MSYNFHEKCPIFSELVTSTPANSYKLDHCVWMTILYHVTNFPWSLLFASSLSSQDILSNDVMSRSCCEGAEKLGQSFSIILNKIYFHGSKVHYKS